MMGASASLGATLQNPNGVGGLPNSHPLGVSGATAAAAMNNMQFHSPGISHGMS